MTRSAPLAAAVFAFLALTVPAYAEIAPSKALIDAAKARGEVGEQADGFLGVVRGGDAALARAVAEINAGRAEVYREAGTKAGSSADVAGAAAAEHQFTRTPPGQYIKPAGEGWRRK